MDEKIFIKPHHFIDILRAVGSGKRKFEPHSYGHAVHIIAEKLLANRDIILEIELGIDDICRPCKHNIDGICDDKIDISFRPTAPESKGQWNLLIDRRWCERLSLKQGDKLSSRQFCERLRDYGNNITDIYREMPFERVHQRELELKKGIEFFLS
jgi:hypothetical protein